MKTNTAVRSMVVAFLVIGMTGFAMAGSTTQTYEGDGTYTTSFGGTGTGDLTIFTHTSYGDDRMSVDWQNTNVGGNQWMNTGSKTGITRDVTVGTGGWQQAASGNIMTGTYSTDTGNGHYIGTVSTYKDDVAYGSHVNLQQTINLYDNGPDEALSGNAKISGFAYGANTLVSGYVEADAGPMFVSAGVGVTEGLFDMSMKTISKDNSASYLDRTKLKNIAVTAVGIGGADLDANGDDVRVGLHTTNDGHWDNFAGSQGTGFNQYDDFDTHYSATGYIYAIEI